MSMIGEFGLCPKSLYGNFVIAVEENLTAQIENSISEIAREIAKTAPVLRNGECSGDVFLALFAYFEKCLNVELEPAVKTSKVAKAWQEVDGGYYFTAFSKEVSAAVNAVADTIDGKEVNRFVCDFYQSDYGEMGQIACDIFLYNIKKMTKDVVLVFRLY